MKRLLTTALLFGYVMLVPFCFFGGMTMAKTETMTMTGATAHHMSDCGIPSVGCVHTMGAVDVDTAVHHVVMYNSITQTPLAAFVIMLALLASLLVAASSLLNNLHSIVLDRFFSRVRLRRADEITNTTRLRMLTWLSLFETSPNFA